MGVVKSENGRPAFGRCDNLTHETIGLAHGLGHETIGP